VEGHDDAIPLRKWIRLMNLPLPGSTVLRYFAPQEETVNETN